MKYKIYIVKNDDREGTPVQFIEAEFNLGCGCDNIEEAMDMITINGDDYKQYTILPYIYMT
jgi:hypothetical protein